MGKPTKDKLIALLTEQIEAAKQGRPPSLSEWKALSGVVLRAAVGDDDDLVSKFDKIKYVYSGPRWSGMTEPDANHYREAGLRSATALLKAAITSLDLRGVVASTDDDPTMLDPSARSDIFIVHGHDDGLKEMVARFLTQLTDKEPIILHEQLNAGDTIIEKLERVGRTAGYAVVLATADDFGRAAAAPDELPRARQNVIFELGYFFAALGRPRVALVYEAGVERPSDTNGILHIPVDGAGAWKIQLMREIEGAGFEVDRNALK